METAPTYANLVHDGDTSVLGLLVKLQHSRRHVASGDDILLVSDGRLDDGGVKSVRDQADDQIVLSDGSIEGLFVVDVERDGSGQLNALGELLGAFESSAGWEGGISWIAADAGKKMKRTRLIKSLEAIAHQQKPQRQHRLGYRAWAW